MPGAIVLVVALAAGAFVLTRDGSGGGTGEIFLEPAANDGPAPFTPTVAAPPASAPLAPDPAAPATTLKVDSATAIQSTDGGRPGLYGGTRNNASCDKAQLIAFLQQNPDKAAAFASVVGIAAADIAAYITALTPVVVRGDTRVTNHGFANGKATPRQAVLQAGTAVLADDRGVPRARCACGNPLAPPTAVQRTVTYRGPSWPGFTPSEVDVVTPSPQPLPELVLTDPVSNTSFARPVGTDGASDGPPGPAVAEPTAATTTTTAAPAATGSVVTSTTEQETNIPRPNADATREGTAGASTMFSDEFPASLGVDGDLTTSWFSSGPGAGGMSVYTWTGARDDLITEVRIIGNGANGNPSFRTGLGFASVTVEVLDAFGDSDFSQTVQLDGTPDPEVLVRPGVDGRIVRLSFRGHEDPTRGGFAELKVGVTR